MNTLEFQTLALNNRKHTSTLDYDSEGNEILKELSDSGSSEEIRDKGDLTSNESLNESYNEDTPAAPVPAPLYVDAPYWYKFGGVMVQFPANAIGK